MKIKLLQIGFVSLLFSLATGCSTYNYLYEGDIYALDDMYGIVDQEAVSYQKQSKAQTRQTATEEARQAALSTGNVSSPVLADTYESAYARRLRGFNSPTYQRPASSYQIIQSDSQFEYLSAYDPAYYNIIVLGDEVWVEPKYITSMFDSWNSPTVYLNFGFGASSIYDYNEIYFGWRYNPYYGWGSPTWSWYYGVYNPYGPYPWYYPYWDPYWYYPPYWGYGPNCWWGHHHHYPSYPGHIASRPNYRRNQIGNRLPSGSFSNSVSGRQFGNSGSRGSSSSVGRGSFSGSGGSSTFRGGSSSSNYRPSSGLNSSSSSSRNNSSTRGTSTFRSRTPIKFTPGDNSGSSFSSGSSSSSSSYSSSSSSGFSGGSFRGSSGGSFSRGGGGGGGGRSYGR